MKAFFALIALTCVLASTSARAQMKAGVTFETYNLVIDDSTPDGLNKCIGQLTIIGTKKGGKVEQVLKNFGIVSMSLSDEALKFVTKLPCVKSVEKNGVMVAQPRTGRVN